MVPRMSASAPLDYLELDPAGHPRVENQEQAFSRTALSFEVIPPRHDADQAKIANLLQVLGSYNPDYIAVTSSKRSGWLEGTAKFIEQISSTTTMSLLRTWPARQGTSASSLAGSTCLSMPGCAVS